MKERKRQQNRPKGSILSVVDAMRKQISAEEKQENSAATDLADIEPK